MIDVEVVEVDEIDDQAVTTTTSSLSLCHLHLGSKYQNHVIHLSEVYSTIKQQLEKDQRSTVSISSTLSTKTTLLLPRATHWILNELDFSNIMSTSPLVAADGPLVWVSQAGTTCHILETDTGFPLSCPFGWQIDCEVRQNRLY
jgi:hypothetical protein